MADLVVESDRVVVRLSRRERILALAPRDPEAPLASVRAARAVRPARAAIRGLRVVGTSLPGVVALGQWRGRGHDFVAVYGGHAGVAVHLDDQPYERFVVSCDDPEAVVEAIERSRSGGSPAHGS